jgi:hypothetical protein
MNILHSFVGYQWLEYLTYVSLVESNRRTAFDILRFPEIERRRYQGPDSEYRF